jgi:uncharacterized membrane protein
MSGLVAVLGALLLSIGVIGLVAANWEAIPRLLRFWLLIATMALSYGAAAFLHGRRQPLYAEAAFLVAGLVFAASIALVGQAYHLAGEFSDAVLLWTLGCIAASLLTRSVAQAALAAVGSAFWTGLLASEASVSPHLPSLGLALGVLALATWVGSHLARGAAILSMSLWIVVSAVTAIRVHEWRPEGAMALLAVLSLGFWMGGVALKSSAVPRLAALGGDLLAPALPSLLLALGFLQVAPRLELDGTSQTWLFLALLGLGAGLASGAAAWKAQTVTAFDLAVAAVLGGSAITLALWLSDDGFLQRLLGSVLVLSACVWTVSLGYRGLYHGGRSLGLAAFAVEVAYIYVLTFGTVLDTALALLAEARCFCSSLSPSFKSIGGSLPRALKEQAHERDRCCRTHDARRSKPATTADRSRHRIRHPG